MTYTIPVRELEKLKKKINHIANKGVEVKFDVGEPYFKNVFFQHPDPATYIYYTDKEPTPIKVVDVDVEGSYKINGWEFVGTIEHKESENIIRAINNNYEIPEEFYHKGPACDHCHRIRDRKDTYLIRNTETGEFKQVGKSCLREYTGGLDAAACAEWSTLDAWLMKMFNAEDMANYEPGFGSGDFYFSGSKIKRIAYNLIKNEGYRKEGYRTVDKVINISIGKEKDKYGLASEEEIKEIDDWADEQKQKLGDAEWGYKAYLRNAIVAWKEKYPEERDLPLIVSLINTYFKAKQDAEVKKAEGPKHESEYLGEVGDNIEFKIASFRLLYTKDPVHYYGSSTYVYQINDEQGNIIILETTNINLEEEDIGKTMKAKIKNLKTYNNTKQTVINRAKMLEDVMSVSDALKYLTD